MPQVPPLVQTSPVDVQVVPQQGCPVPPHGVQVPAAAQTSAEVLHALAPAQQGWPLAPQALQLPPEQTVPVALHELPAQQGWSMPPHATQVELEQTEAPVQTFPQHGWLTFPHAWHMPPVPQIAPVLQDVPQQGCLSLPQATHMLPEHR